MTRPKKNDTVAAKRAAVLYRNGASIVTIMDTFAADGYAVSDTTVRAWLDAEGVQRRPAAETTETADDVDVDELVRLRDQQRLSWAKIADQMNLGRDPSTVARIYRRATGEAQPARKPAQSLTTEQTRELETLWGQVPPGRNGLGHDPDSAQGRAVVTLLAAYHAAGVSYRELGEALGATRQLVHSMVTDAGGQ
ncbi:hypothetical protein ACIBCN_18710 [Nocardia sp. NPDC051052]|uniref:hypothetical protein n=1 Tax=Nocardia sp. NPDC051052 TaxID=3364322 RepID=UPI00378F7A70